MTFCLSIRWRRITRLLRFAGCFPHSQNQSYNSPLQICIARQMLFSKITQTICSFQIGTKNPTKKKIIVEPSFFTSWTIANEKCTRAHVQENKSIYLSIYLSIWKPFWKRVYMDRFVVLFCCTCARAYFSLLIVQLVKKLGSTINSLFFRFFVPICQ